MREESVSNFMNPKWSELQSWEPLTYSITFFDLRCFEQPLF